MPERHAWRVLLLAVIATLVPACGVATTAPTTCASSRECFSAGLVCDIEHARCVECVRDPDCLTAGQVCIGNTCRTTTHCVSSRECAGQVCDPALGYCVDCVDAIDCPSGQVCDHSVCTSPAIDGGIDAAASDDGGLDMGAEPIDVGAPDDAPIGPPDAGPPDAGPPDMGTDPCATPGTTETVSCPGMCATIDRFCNSGHVWQYGVCVDHGDCVAGTTRTAPCGTTTITQSCDTTCHWSGACAVDVVLVLDVTGSLAPSLYSGSGRDSLFTAIVLPLLASTSADVHVGLATFRDVGDTDVFRGVVPPTNSSSTLQTAIGGLMGSGGGDTPEGGVLALGRLAGGAASETGTTDFSCPAGTGAGGCWRPGARHAVLLISDAQFHNAPDGVGGIIAMATTAPPWTDVVTRLRSSTVDVFSMTSSTANPMWNQMELDLLAAPTERVHVSAGFGSGTLDWNTEFGALVTLIRTAYAL